MPSPFPGMDPFLEDHWGDVHHSLLAGTRSQLRGRLPPDLRARVEEYTSLEIVDDDGDESVADEPPQWRKPDVRIVEPSAASTVGILTTPGIECSPAIEIPVDADELWRIVVTESKTERLITVIEILSPGNKFGRSRRKFLERQAQFVDAGVNIVEIDLLRAGGWSVSAPRHTTPAECRQPYRILTRAAGERVARMYPTSIREPLPTIGVPLREHDAPVALQLQALIQQAWEDGNYTDIDYAHDRLPKFSPDDTQWIIDHLASQGIQRAPVARPSEA